MSSLNQILLTQIDTYLARSRMGESYFGKKAVGNSELVSRLRAGRRIWPETADRVLAFMSENPVVVADVQNDRAA
ncbi:hypothetical protein [Ketogulonicigenium vulgare]|uniref:hypothetical protein n=1 Tax=Ketogulonicigenium vulgare TaxID=92945 RepID=UPI002359F895|nr:hypothetical protein [Ketogulonicigenium vulgare]